MAVSLRPVTRENWRDVARLQVAEEQRGFVVYEEQEHECWAKLRLPVSTAAGEE